MPYRKRQMYGNSCGAASMLCAALELGVRNLPNIPGSLCMGQPLATDGGCESALYQISSGATSGSRPVGMNLANGGYSLPHNLIFAARLLGLNATVYLQPGFYSSALETLYSSCVRNCVGSGILVHRTAPPPLTFLQRELRVVGVLKVVGLHYVLRRPDGTFMDPADGADYATFDAMNNAWTKCYGDTGISIILDRAVVVDGLMGRQAERDQRLHARRGGARESPF